MGKFDRFKQKKEPSATIKIDLSAVKYAIQKRGKAPLRAQMISQLIKDFRKKADERREAKETVVLETWFKEYTSDREYKVAAIMLAELDIFDEDMKVCMAKGISGEVENPTVIVKPSAENNYHGTPRNSPCPCGSGKKYKRCHGA